MGERVVVAESVKVGAVSMARRVGSKPTVGLWIVKTLAKINQVADLKLGKEMKRMDGQGWCIAKRIVASRL